MTTETWRRIKSFPDYSVSSLGRVRRDTRGFSTYPGRIVRPKIESHGYARVNLNGIDCRIHQLVMEAFRGPRPEGMDTCHNNGDPSDNRLENLRYDTKAANSADRVLHGTANRGERHGMARLTKADVTAIRLLLTTGLNSVEIGPMFGVHPRTIRDIHAGKTWSWFDETENA